jgi:hypothetical protein
VLSRCIGYFLSDPPRGGIAIHFFSVVAAQGEHNFNGQGDGSRFSKNPSTHLPAESHPRVRREGGFIRRSNATEIPEVPCSGRYEYFSCLPGC